jgi:hypothetical protein
MNEPIDFSSLRLSDQRRDVLVASVLLQSGHELTRRANGTSAIVFLGMWARPALAAAAIVAAICGTMLAGSASNRTVADGTAEMAAMPGAGIAEALGVSRAMTTFLNTDRTPTASELLAVVEENAQ